MEKLHAVQSRSHFIHMVPSIHCFSSGTLNIPPVYCMCVIAGTVHMCHSGLAPSVLLKSNPPFHVTSLHSYLAYTTHSLHTTHIYTYVYLSTHFHVVVVSALHSISGRSVCMHASTHRGTHSYP